MYDGSSSRIVLTYILVIIWLLAMLLSMLVIEMLSNNINCIEAIILSKNIASCKNKRFESFSTREKNKIGVIVHIEDNNEKLY